MAFRDAHEVVGKSVAYCLSYKKDLPDLTLAEWQSFSTMIGADIYENITLEASVNSRTATGGTSLEGVKREIARLKSSLS